MKFIKYQKNVGVQEKIQKRLFNASNKKANFIQW